jgi:putative heme-binding domain-containing protein
VGGQWRTVAVTDPPQPISEGQAISFDPLTLQVTVEPAGGGWRAAFNNAGEKFICHPWDGVSVAVHQAGELDRNPFAPPLAAVARVLPAQPGLSPAACLVYRGGRYEPKWQGALFLADPAHRGIRAVALDAQGLHSRVQSGSAVLTLASSDDTLFRPTALEHGPDDAIYIADLCRAAHPHGAQSTDPTNTAPKGRIWRLVQEPTASAPSPTPDWTSKPALAASLGQTNAWVRDTAARLLFEQRATNMAPVFRTMLQRTVWPVARLEALRSLDAANLVTVRDLTGALADKDPVVRAEAARMAGRLDTPRGASSLLLPQLRGLIVDPSPRVRFAASIAVGGVPHVATPEALADSVSREPANPWLHHVALTAAPFHQEPLFLLLLDTPAVADSIAGRALLRELAVTIGLSDVPGAVSACLAALSERTTDWALVFQLAAALGEGTEGCGLSLPQVDREGQWVNLAGSALGIMLDGTDLAQRMAAAQFVETCVGSKFPAGDGLTLLFAPGLPEALLPGFIRTLARDGSDRSLAALTQRWELWNAAARQDIIDVLLQSDAGREALAGALSRNVIPPEVLNSTQLEVLRALSTPEQKGRLGGILPAERPNRDAILKGFLSVLEQSGNVSNGRQLFEQRCSACHNLSVASLGPKPTDLAQLSRMQRLAGILDPSRDLSPRHTTSLVTLKDGRTVWGVVHQPNPAVLHVVTPEGLRRYRTSGISGRVGQDWSLMPVNVGAGLSREEVTDLLEFLGRPW